MQARTGRATGTKSFTCPLWKRPLCRRSPSAYHPVRLQIYAISILRGFVLCRRPTPAISVKLLRCKYIGSRYSCEGKNGGDKMVDCGEESSLLLFRSGQHWPNCFTFCGVLREAETWLGKRGMEPLLKDIRPDVNYLANYFSPI